MLRVVLPTVAEIEDEDSIDASSYQFRGLVMKLHERDQADRGHVYSTDQSIHLIQEQHPEV